MHKKCLGTGVMLSLACWLSAQGTPAMALPTASECKEHKDMLPGCGGGLSGGSSGTSRGSSGTSRGSSGTSRGSSGTSRGRITKDPFDDDLAPIVPIRDPCADIASSNMPECDRSGLGSNPSSGTVRRGRRDGGTDANQGRCMVMVRDGGTYTFVDIDDEYSCRNIGAIWTTPKKKRGKK